MKIDLAVWTAVNGYEWQPGSVYSQRELAGYKDAIGPLEQYSLPLGGLFLKDGKAVFFRVQIADRMDSRGRGAIYLVLGTVPEENASGVDFAEIFNSPEMAKPQKPFPTAIEHDVKPCECKTPLGRVAFTERRFNGAGTFSDLGGWCAEAQGGKLNVQITGTMESPLFTVGYAPYVAPAPVKKEPERPQERHSPEDSRGESLPLFERQYREASDYGRQYPHGVPRTLDGASHTYAGTSRTYDDTAHSPHREAGLLAGRDKLSFELGFYLGLLLGFVLSSLVFLAISKIDWKWLNGEGYSTRFGRAKIANTFHRDNDGDAAVHRDGDEQWRQNQEREDLERR